MSTKVWRIDREEVLHRLKAWAQELAQNSDVLAVVVFGSLARGDCTPASDADVLILLSHAEARFQDRIFRFLPLGLGIGVDPFPYTVEEAQQALAERWGVVEVALREGLVLCERQGVLAKLKEVSRGSQSRPDQETG